MPGLPGAPQTPSPSEGQAFWGWGSCGSWIHSGRLNDNLLTGCGDMQVADSYHLASGRGHIRAGRFGEPEQGLRSSSCWVLGSRRKQGTALPASLECLFFQLSVLPCVQGALPGGGGGKGSGPRGTEILHGRTEVEAEGQHRSRSQDTALGKGRGGLGLRGVRGLGGGRGDTVLGSV